ncbi:MAG: hypothetical protein HRU09_07925 [Oligoflexales bacterium]|nr:hypothetical protein [Oligoflexales bacterium]
MQVKKSLEKICNSFLFYFYFPIILNAIYIASLVLNGTAFVFQLAIWCLFLFVGILNIRFALALFFLTLCFFEQLTLKFCLPNQFIIENAVLAIVLVSGFTNLREIPDGSVNFIHPLVVPSLFAIIFTIFSFLCGLIDLQIASKFGISLTLVIKDAIKNILLWDVDLTNPTHPLSLCYSYLLFVCFVVNTRIGDKSKVYLSDREFLECILYGSVLVFLYGLAQLVGLIENNSSAGLEATFQNPNHLSFYSGLIVIAALIYQKVHKSRRLSSTIIIIFAAISTVLGRGKSAWVALILALLFLLLINSRRIIGRISRLGRLTKTPLYLFCALAALFFFTLFLKYSGIFTKIGLNHEIEETKYIFNKVRRFDFSALLVSGGRKQHLEYALLSISKYPFLGSGWGSFYVNSQSGYDLHYSYLSWLYSFGIGGGVVFVFSVLKFLIYLIKKNDYLKKNVYIPMGLIIYIALSHIVDVYFIYRPFLYLIGAIFSYFTQSLSLRLNGRGCWYYSVIIASVILGISTARNPQLRHPLLHKYKNEKHHDEKIGEISWYAYGKKIVISPQKCWVANVNSIDYIEPIYLEVRLIEGLSEAIERFNDIAMIKASHLAVFNIWANVWSEVCICNTRNAAGRVFLNGSTPLIPRYTKSLGFSDHRLLSFSLANERYIDRNSVFDLGTGRGCDHYEEI